MLSGMAISPNKAWAKLSEAANLEENKVILALQRISCTDHGAKLFNFKMSDIKSKTDITFKIFAFML